MNNKIVIDPGHGPGNANKGPTGYYEYQGMWKLSGYLKKELEALGFDVTLTRGENEDPGLNARGRKAAGAALFISEHSNAASGAARGVEVYYSVQAPGDKELAAAFSKGTSALMGNPDRGAMTRPSTNSPAVDYYTVMASARAVGCPHVLLAENGFHDNLIDEAFLKNDANLAAIANLHARVILEYLGKPDTGGTPIMGVSELTAAELAAALISKNPAPKLNCGAMELAAYFLAEGDAEGVRGDAAFFQAMHETGWLRFGGQVLPEQNNYGGLGATNGGAAGASFETPEYGVRAQIQHLKAYASREPLNLNRLDPRFDLVARGSAPCWEDLNGKWAVPGDGYGQAVVALLESALAGREPTPGEDGDMGLFVINGKDYTMKRILVDGRNYIELNGLTAAGFTVAWDEARRAAVVTTPGN